MERKTVVQEFVFDLAANRILPSKLTGYGFYGRPVQFDMGVSPQMIYEVVHRDDLDKLMAHIEQACELQAGETVSTNVRFLHTCGEYVDTLLEARFEELMNGDRVRMIRSTSTWVAPEGVEPTFAVTEAHEMA
ncbi:MAG TPA: hypothetical protein VK934_04755 [Fimbriimonas sp.]|nr:hypothetical protein [Fimbriimonas sp.]